MLKSYLELFTAWVTQKYFLRSFNVLIEIQCLILPSKFLLQWYTQKDIMLASFRFLSYSVKSFSSPDLCTPPHVLKNGVSAEFEKKKTSEKSTCFFWVALILWAYFWVIKYVQVWRPSDSMWYRFEIEICTGQFFVLLGSSEMWSTGMFSFDVVTWITQVLGHQRSNFNIYGMSYITKKIDQKCFF